MGGGRLGILLGSWTKGDLVYADDSASDLLYWHGLVSFNVDGQGVMGRDNSNAMAMAQRLQWRSGS